MVMDQGEMERLRSELFVSIKEELKEEMLEARAERAASRMELMRTWLQIYTAGITVLLAFFAILGFRGYSDIQTNRERVQKQAEIAASETSEASTIVAGSKTALEDVNHRLDALKSREKVVDDLIERNRSAVKTIEDSVKSLQA